MTLSLDLDSLVEAHSGGMFTQVCRFLCLDSEWLQTRSEVTSSAVIEVHTLLPQTPATYMTPGGVISGSTHRPSAVTGELSLGDRFWGTVPTRVAPVALPSSSLLQPTTKVPRARQNSPTSNRKQHWKFHRSGTESPNINVQHRTIAQANNNPVDSQPCNRNRRSQTATMKTDQYLNLCLDQAALSTLHYRHGCVVVKGGKVIGQGFNDCRPGYDGGSVLKTGALPKAAANVKPDKPDPPKHKSDFKAVESVIGNCGGGHHANARLTMHSEMMAINSALSSRSTLAVNTVSHVKPCFKLLGDSKRKRELQRNAVLSYAQAVCLATFGQEVQQGAGAAEANESRVRPSTYRRNDLLSDDQETLSSSLQSSLLSVSEREGVQEQVRVQQVQQVQV